MKKTRSIQEVSWLSVRDEVKKVNPGLAEIIDQINPGANLKLLKASYLFGDLIVKDGAFCLPPILSEHSTQIDLHQKVLDQLSYSSIPLALVLNKTCEVFLENATISTPLNILNPGHLFGTFEMADYLSEKSTSPIWNVSAGVRTIFMLPRLSENSGLKRLQTEFRIKSDLHLHTISDHWKMFSQIANSENFEEEWSCDVLLFEQKWFDPKHVKNEWKSWEIYLLKAAWLQAQYLIAKFKFSRVWKFFTEGATKRHLKPSVYIADTIRHLLAIEMGLVPGFTVIEDSNLAAPIRGLQKVFIETYNLKKHLPTLMQPMFLSNSSESAVKNSPVYYSLNFPTLLEGYIDDKRTVTLMCELKQIKTLFETLKKQGWKGELLNNTELNYFHVDKDESGEILSSVRVIEFDDKFRKLKSLYPDREFCSTSPFWRGCISLLKRSY